MRSGVGDRTAGRPECPGGDGDGGEDEGCEDVEAIGAVPADRGAGGCGAGEVEEDSGVGPLLEERAARDEDGDGSEELPDAEDGEEVRWVAELRAHGPVRIGAVLQDLSRGRRRPMKKATRHVVVQ